MRTSNPALNAKEVFPVYGYTNRTDVMTMSGVVTKTMLLLLVSMLSASWIWFQFYKSGGNKAVISTWMMGGLIGGLVLAFATIFKPAWSAVTAPLYALLEGFVIGGLSALMEASFPGIVIQATVLTFGTLFAMLAAYRSGWIQVTEKFKLGVVAATGGIALVYIISIILGFFGIPIPFLFGGGITSILFSLFVVVIAALNFVLDFDFIEQSAKRGAPKYMEWYSGFALMVTLIWLYIELLRLLSMLRSRQ